MTSKITMNVQLFSIIALLAIIPFSGSAFASNSLDQFWVDETQTYVCTNDLQNDITVTGNVSICTDLATSADRWNSIPNSDWDLSTSGSGNDTNVEANNLATGTLGLFSYTYNGSDEFQSGIIEYNTDYSWGDTIDGDTGVYDFQSVGTHEFGHLSGLAHTVNTSSVMYAGLSLNDDNREPTSHDYDELEDKYPN